MDHSDGCQAMGSRELSSGLSEARRAGASPSPFRSQVFELGRLLVPLGRPMLTLTATTSPAFDVPYVSRRKYPLRRRRRVSSLPLWPATLWVHGNGPVGPKNIDNAVWTCAV
jgi:hypothetical protein